MGTSWGDLMMMMMTTMMTIAMTTVGMTRHSFKVGKGGV
jgi:hypothetical protein